MEQEIKNEVKGLKIGEKILSLRKTEDLSTADLAKKCGVSEVVLSQIESDIISPTVAALLKIAKVFNKELNFFFQEVEEDLSIEVVRKNELYPCIVICPKSLKTNWYREIKRMDHYKKVDLVKNSKHEIEQKNGKFAKDYTIVNYDLHKTQALEFYNPGNELKNLIKNMGFLFMRKVYYT